MKRALMLLALVLFAGLIYAINYGQPVGPGETTPFAAYGDTTVGSTDTTYSDSFRVLTAQMTGTMSMTWSIDNRDDAATNDVYLGIQYTDDPEIGWFEQTLLDSMINVAADDTTSSSCSWNMKTYRYAQFYHIKTATSGDTIYYRKGTWFKAGR